MGIEYNRALVGVFHRLVVTTRFFDFCSFFTGRGVHDFDELVCRPTLLEDERLDLDTLSA